MGEVISRLDDLQAKLTFALSNLAIINESIEDDVVSEAAFCVWSVISNISQDMAQQISDAYKIINNRNGKEV